MKRLPRIASIYTAELTAIDLALDIIKNSWSSKFMVYSNSKSSLLVLKNRNMNNLLIIKLCNRVNNLCNMKTIIFCWILSHVGICRYEKITKAVKRISTQYKNSKIPYMDLKPIINSFITNGKLFGKPVQTINGKQLNQQSKRNIKVTEE